MLFHSVIGASGNNANVIKSASVVNTQTQISYNGSITMPSDIQEGDLILVCQITGRGGSSYPSITIAYGTGFTGINYETGLYTINSHIGRFYYKLIGAVSYKIADGTESGTTNTGFMNSGGEGYVLFHIRANIAISSVNAIFITTSATAGDPQLYTINTTGEIEIAYYMNGSSNFVTSIVTNPASNIQISGTDSIYAGITSGLWISSVSSSYTFNSSDGGSMNIPMGGRLIIS